MAGEDEKWLVLVLKDKFSNDVEREGLRNCLLRNFPLGEREVCYVKVDDCSAMGNFLFVREHDPEDLRRIIEFRRDAFEAYPSHMRITDEELERMVQGISSSRKVVSPKHGDVVLVRKGRFSKLYGIVLRECRSSKVDVGLKFCFGTVTEQYKPDDLEIVGNIFNYLKVLK